MHGHEIKFRSDGGDPNDPRNVIALCYTCHLNGVHRQTATVDAWFVVVVINLELGAEDPAGIAFEPFKTKGQRWAELAGSEG